MERPTCKTCPYWFREFDAGDHGECRQGPPPEGRHECENLGDGEETNIVIGYWRSTKESEGCGAHPDFPAYIESLKPTSSLDNEDLISFANSMLSMRARNSITRAIAKKTGNLPRYDAFVAYKNEASRKQFSALTLQDLKKTWMCGKTLTAEIVAFARDNGIEIQSG